MQPKQHFITKLEETIEIKQDTKILDLGSGQSKNWIPLLKKYPSLQYIGIEPKKSDAEIARNLLKNFKNIKIYNQLAYKIDNLNNFDICISISVLEHVKQLEKFLISSIESVKSGGYIIHRYDLGHSLYPGSFKERLQVFLGNNFPKLLPEKKFVRYLDEKKICKFLEENGVKIQKITYHQMPNHKAFLKFFETNTDKKLSLANKILDWEYETSEFLYEINQKQRELLFPAITIWAIKK